MNEIPQQSSGSPSCRTEAALLATTVALATPAAIYSASRDDFAFGLLQIAGILLALWVVLFASAVLIGRLLPKGSRRGWSSLLFAVGTLAWLLSNVFVYDVGLLDGDSLQTAEMQRWFLPELAAVAVWLLVATIGGGRWPSASRRIAALLLFVTAGSTAVALAQDFPKWRSLQAADRDELYSFHPGENVLIVLLDTFQADLFEQTLDDHPEIAAAFDGFVFFPDTAGLAPSTAMTMPGIHTGLEYDLTWNVPTFYDEAKKREGFLEAVARSGHRVTTINPFGFCPSSGVLCTEPELVAEAPARGLMFESFQLVDLAIFRAVPLVLKESVYSRGGWFFLRLLGLNSEGGRVGMSIEFLKGVSDEAELSAPQATTKFIHLAVPHPPLVTNEDCSYAEEPRERHRSSLLDQGRCALVAYVEVLETLKQLAIYDSATLVLMSDHGARIPSRYTEKEKGNRRWRGQVGSANPMLAVKPPSNRGPIRNSRRQARISDVGATVCGLIDGCSYESGESLLPGESLLQSESSSARSRRYLYYRAWLNEYWHSDEPVPTEIYQIEGTIGDDSSWRIVAD